MLGVGRASPEAPERASALISNWRQRARLPERSREQGHMPWESLVICPFSQCVLSHSVMPDSVHPRDHSWPGSSVRGTLQARTLEWVAISSSRGSSRPRD